MSLYTNQSGRSVLEPATCLTVDSTEWAPSTATWTNHPRGASDAIAVDDPDQASDDTPTTPGTVEVVVHHAEGTTRLTAPRGRVLRDVLLEADLSPYTRVTERVNCGGRGLCATCGVRLRSGPSPDHWHDRLAARFGYPRLSCQIRLEADVMVELDAEKVVWGRREPE